MPLGKQFKSEHLFSACSPAYACWGLALRHRKYLCHLPPSLKLSCSLPFKNRWIIKLNCQKEGRSRAGNIWTFLGTLMESVWNLYIMGLLINSSYMLLLKTTLVIELFIKGVCYAINKIPTCVIAICILYYFLLLNGQQLHGKYCYNSACVIPVKPSH